MEPGLIFAYVAIGIMALLPIYFGAHAAVKLNKKKSGSKDEKDDSDEAEFFSLNDAKWFPIIGSITLFSLYLAFTYLDKELINTLLTVYFCVLGVGSSTKLFLIVGRAITGWELKGDYHLLLTKKGQEVISQRFGMHHFALLGLSTALTVYYAITKHWIVSNVLGEAFSVTAVQLLNLDSFTTGIVLLAALFVYDIFWVFGTDVMVTVARNFDAPIKVVFPKDFLGLFAEGLWKVPEKGTPFTMLGLGDIVIPGIFVALCLQFDYHNYLKTAAGKKNPATYSFPKPYFTTCFIFYTLGLVTTIVVMHAFQAAQPALLYLSPACIMSALLTALARGEWNRLFSYVPEEVEERREKEKAAAAAKDGKEKKHRKKKEGSAEPEGVQEVPAGKEEMASPGTPSKRKGKKQ
ncbi:signal peptide peptidase [Cladochytrium replicatum]|nr:signal peptide peptidase [Cladochytrium replicatum]